MSQSDVLIGCLLIYPDYTLLSFILCCCSLLYMIVYCDFFTIHYVEVDIVNILKILRLEFLKGNSLKIYVFLTFPSLFFVSVKYEL